MDTRPRPDYSMAGLTAGLLLPGHHKVQEVTIEHGRPGLPFFGPKRRAIDSLQGYDGDPLTDLEALRLLTRKWPDLAAGIARVRSYQFLRVQGHPESGELRILHCWTHNDARRRALLYETAPEITKRIGWYPLITGPWRGAGRTAAVQLAQGAVRASGYLDLTIGRPRAIRDLTHGAGDRLGTAIEIEGSDGSLLLDLGWDAPNPAFDAALGRARLALLSHAHRDHAGGLPQLLSHSNAPILMTELTLLQLLTLYMRLDAATLRPLLQRAVVCPMQGRLRLGNDMTVDWWPANHSPGSIMTVATFADGPTVLYSGDFSLANAYSDSVLLSPGDGGPTSPPACVDLAVVDGTFLGRELGHSRSTQPFLEAVAGSVGKGRAALIIADEPDNALPLFFELHKLFMTGPNKLRTSQVYVDDSIGALMTLLSSAFQRQKSEDMDPIVRSLWVARKDPFEPHQSWGIDSNVEDNVRFHTYCGDSIVLLMTTRELEGAPAGLGAALEFLGQRGLDTFLIGRAASRPFAGRLHARGMLEVRGADRRIRGVVHDVNDEKWLLHSGSRELCAWMAGAYGQELRRIRIFHTFPSHIRKALRDLELPDVAWLKSEETLMTPDEASSAAK